MELYIPLTSEGSFHCTSFSTLSFLGPKYMGKNPNFGLIEGDIENNEISSFQKSKFQATGC